MIAIGRIRPRCTYVLPGVHLAICLVSYLGLLVPSLSNLAIAFEALFVLDFPISVVAFMLAWKYQVLAYIWIVVVGTLWWYLLGLGISKFRQMARGE